MSDYQLFVIALRVPSTNGDWTPEDVREFRLRVADHSDAGIAEVTPQDENNGWASAMLDAAVQLGVLDERSAA